MSFSCLKVNINHNSRLVKREHEDTEYFHFRVKKLCVFSPYQNTNEESVNASYMNLLVAFIICHPLRTK